MCAEGVPRPCGAAECLRRPWRSSARTRRRSSSPPPATTCSFDHDQGGDQLIRGERRTGGASCTHPVNTDCVQPSQKSHECEFPHVESVETHPEVGLCTASDVPRDDQRQGSNDPHAVHKFSPVAHRPSPRCPQGVHRFIHNLIELNRVVHREWGQPGQNLGSECGSNPPQLWTASLVDKSIHSEADSSPVCPQEHPQRCTVTELRKRGLSPTSTGPTTTTPLVFLSREEKKQKTRASSLPSPG